MKKLIYTLLSVLVCFAFVSCKDIEVTLPEETTEAVTLPQPYPVEVGSLTFLDAPQTVASLSPAITEIVCELGYTERLTGKSTYCTAGSASAKEIGSSANPDIDAITALAPQLLITQSPIAKKDITTLEAAGVRVLIMPTPTDYDGLFECYRSIAAVFRGDLAADSAADEALSPLSDAVAAITKNDYTYAYIVTPDLAVVSEETFLSLYGTNVAADTEDYSMTADELIAADPQIIFLASPLTAANLPPELANVSAVRNGMVISIDNTVLERPTAAMSGLINEVNAAIANPTPVAPPETVPTEESEAAGE